MRKYIPFLLIIIFLFPPISFAAKYELAICVVDEPETYRKKEGDIVAIKPYPWNWGRQEIDAYLIVIIETSKSYQVLQKLVNQPVYRDLVTGGNPLVKQSDYFSLIDDGGRNKDEFEIAYQNRFQISHAKTKAGLTDLDLAKVRDKSKIYQPFKSASQLIQAFDGENGNRFLELKDVDCASSIKLNDKTEFSINLDAISAVILDKYTGSLVKP